MFANAPALLTVALAAIVTAVPTHLTRDGGGGGGIGGGNCNANALCCDNVGSASSLGDLTGLLGIAVGLLNGNLGIGCIPIEVIDLIPDHSCNAQSVCCEGTTFSNLQLIGLNCDPLDVL
ncbi:hydrophobin-251 [Pisolithus orientalis]|uniref:hydrophobin-251 n=1 Tax=Pisolithus orientalis TaxID=936130 RepID=UPI0022256984|nr:hydrophobin-251 [Pisolithus orientalis]KAI6015224.1 hydrophobin-251 [Pisolithus orientalis]